jgi:hypothetical protein
MPEDPVAACPYGKPDSAVVGFNIWQNHRQLVGWAECNETQRNDDKTQPNYKTVKTLFLQKLFDYPC